MTYGRKTGGKVKGSKNKATLEREAQVRLERERLAEIERLEKESGVSAQGAAAATAGKKLMKEIAFDFAAAFAGIAAFHQPWKTWHEEIQRDGTKKKVNDNPHYNEAKFKEYGILAANLSIAAAPYQSPRLSAVMVGAAVVTEIEITGGLPDAEDGGLNPGPRQIEGTAEEVEPAPLPKAVNE